METGWREAEQEKLKQCVAENKPYFGRLFASAQGDPVRLAFLKHVIAEMARKRQRVTLLEIGSWAGGSAVAMAGALKENGGNGVLFCVDPWRPYTLNGSQTMTEGMRCLYDEMKNTTGDDVMGLFQHNVRATGVESLVVPVRGKSADVVPLLKPDSFDLVFIDGDHRYEAVKRDIEMVMPLIMKGGIMCGDDFELKLEDVDQETLMNSGDTDYVYDPRAKRWYHPGVTRAVHEKLGGVVSVVSGLWVVQKS